MEADKFKLVKRVGAEVRSLVSEGYLLLGEADTPVVWRFLKHKTNGNVIRIIDGRMTINNRFRKFI